MDISGRIIEFINYYVLPLLEACKFLVPLATLIGIFFVVKTFISNNLIRRMELINKIYTRFVDEKLYYEFYIKVCNQTMNWKCNKIDEQLLNDSLTLFDEVNYLRTQKLLDNTAWEYVACEIQNFASNEGVWDYMCKFLQDYKDKGFPKDIIPFTGFPDLLEKMPKQFRAKQFLGVPDQYRELLKQCYSPQSKCRNFIRIFYMEINICEVCDGWMRYCKCKMASIMFNMKVRKNK